MNPPVPGRYQGPLCELFKVVPGLKGYVFSCGGEELVSVRTPDLSVIMNCAPAAKVRNAGCDRSIEVGW